MKNNFGGSIGHKGGSGPIQKTSIDQSGRQGKPCPECGVKGNRPVSGTRAGPNRRVAPIDTSSKEQSCKD